MILKRFYHEGLAQASYLVGCTAAGEALVVDPHRDVEIYLDAAREAGVSITHVIETHIHADFVSGSRELAARAGATLLLSGEGGAEWSYRFAAESGARLLRDRDSFRVGSVRLDVRHTPGHTPEHLTFLVTDTAAADRPMGAFTGDFLFAGDVGRPDLLERAAGVAGTKEESARALFRSLRRFLAEQPEYLQIWPGHGAGSACGKGMSAVPQTTLGYERLFNAALALGDEERFVAAVLDGQPAPPRYFARMKRENRDGPPLLGGLSRPPRLTGARLRELRSGGALVVDTRLATAFATGHLPGALNLPFNRSFTTWAGWLLPDDRDLHLIVDDERVDEVVRDLAIIGLDRVAAYAPADELSGALATVERTSVGELREALERGTAAVIDVRWPDEWAAGHLPGVPNLPIGSLAERVAELPSGRPLVVHCQGGTRSAITVSLLKSLGVDGVVDLPGGFAAWSGAGLPVERPTPGPPADAAG